MHRILFITHNASRTGAPLMLLYFLQWLKHHHSEILITLITLEGGELANEFKKTSYKFYDLTEFAKTGETFSQNLKKRILQKVGKYRPKPHPMNLFIEKIASEKFDLIYANSVASAPFAYKIKKVNSSTKLLLHVHELNTIITLITPNFQKYIPGINRLIAASNLVKNNLIKNYGCREEKVNIVYEFTKKHEITAYKKEEKFIVGGAGTVHWRKGSDLFIQVAKQIFNKYSDLEIKFEWVGSISQEKRIILEADLYKLELQKVISFVGPKENPRDHFNNFDIFLLPSREDPFPLVAIEMGMLGKPIICFDKATGTAEVLCNGGGYIVPYMDVAGMVEKVLFYYFNRPALIQDGEKAKELFSVYTQDKVCPKLLEIIQDEINE